MIFKGEGNDEIWEASRRKAQFGQLYKSPGFINSLIIQSQLSLQQQQD